MTPQSLELKIDLPQEQDTHQLGVLIAKHLIAPLTCYLQGELGVGKTRLVRAIIQSLGYSGNVKSPTFTLVEPYELETITAYHFDLYRLSDPEELDYVGIRDYFSLPSVAFIEWPEKGKGWLSDADICILLEFNGQGRNCTVLAKTAAGILLLNKLKQNI